MGNSIDVPCPSASFTDATKGNRVLVVEVIDVEKERLSTEITSLPPLRQAYSKFLLLFYFANTYEFLTILLLLKKRTGKLELAVDC